MTDELPPLWALDMAAKAAGTGTWNATVRLFSTTHTTTDSIIAHAHTLAKHETPPVDPAEEQRWEDAREAAAQYCEAIRYDRGAREARDGHRDDDCCIRSAYIALCNRDGVTPNLGAES